MCYSSLQVFVSSVLLAEWLIHFCASSSRHGPVLQYIKLVVSSTYRTAKKSSDPLAKRPAVALGVLQVSRHVVYPALIWPDSLTIG